GFGSSNLKVFVAAPTALIVSVLTVALKIGGGIDGSAEAAASACCTIACWPAEALLSTSTVHIAWRRAQNSFVRRSYTTQKVRRCSSMVTFTSLVHVTVASGNVRSEVEFISKPGVVLLVAAPASAHPVGGFKARSV